MEQQKTGFQTLICSLNAGELQSLILQLSENDASLSDRMTDMIRHLFPNKEVSNAPQWDPDVILEQAYRILNPRKKSRSDHYEMEVAGDAYDDLLLSLQGIFQASPKAQVIQTLRGLTELVAEDLDRIMSGCDEGLPWQSVAEQLGAYWFQLASCKDLSDTDRSSLLSLLSKWVHQLANYGLDDHFSQAMQVLQKRSVKGYL
jgi:hypothetical protein